MFYVWPNLCRHQLLCLKLRYGKIYESDKIMFENLEKGDNIEVKEIFTPISI